MLVRIVGDVDDIQSLREWMSRDDEIPGLVKPAVTNIPGTIGPGGRDLVLCRRRRPDRIARVAGTACGGNNRCVDCSVRHFGQD